MSTFADEKVDNICDSSPNLFQQAEESTATTRPQRNSKRSARSRILESFRESPLARGSECVYPSIISCCMHMALHKGQDKQTILSINLRIFSYPSF